jgi:hypothetical protein
MLEGLQPPQQVRTCGVRTLRATLDEADLIIFDRALADYDSWPHKTLARALNGRGVVISDKPIRMHRAGRCSCR